MMQTICVTNRQNIITEKNKPTHAKGFKYFRSFSPKKFLIFIAWTTAHEPYKIKANVVSKVAKWTAYNIK